jgi:predicted nucleotidyltransferase
MSPAAAIRTVVMRSAYPGYRRDMGEQLFSQMAATLKKAAAALRDAGVPFLLAGSLASWARGGPETRHDLDFIVRPDDAERAMEALEAAGLRRDDPPEEWLLKAWDGEVLVDLIFAPTGVAVDDEMFARADTINVLSMELQVMSLEDLMVTKLLSITEHEVRFEHLIAMARAVREQIPWERIQQRTRENPFAAAFFVLCEELGIKP